MSSLNDVLNSIQDAVTDLLGIDIAAIKAAVIASGGQEAWDVIGYLTNPKVLLLALIPCLVIERLRPAVPHQAHRTGGLLLDFLYPIPRLLIPTAFLGLGTMFAMYIYKTYLPFLNTGLLDGQPLWLQTLGAFLISDFMFYWSHRIRHEVRWFWHFHAIHHSQRNLNPATTHRTHPVESIVSGAIRTIPIAFVGGSYPAWVLFVVLNNFWGYFIHANIRTNLGWLGNYIVSPQYHRVHHSTLEEHFDINYGERLVIWDKLFGSYCPDRNVYPPTGIPNAAWIDERSNNPLMIPLYYLKQMAYPFVRIGQSVGQNGRLVLARLRAPRQA